ncbi:MAG TPA: hypothetical protein VG889_12410 [Rhizomicrobium sp.]|nr:hypothetical protein [Rhizomicrobium sp.]
MPRLHRRRGRNRAGLAAPHFISLAADTIALNDLPVAYDSHGWLAGKIVDYYKRPVMLP